MKSEQPHIAFIGTGQMATALATGFARELLSPGQITGYDPFDEARQRFVASVGDEARVSDSLADVVTEADVVFLAVKPQVMPVALSQLKSILTPHQLVVSVAAGVTLHSLCEALPAATRLIRVMPNTPCLIGRGAAGLSAGQTATADDIKLITQLLQTVGIVELVPEKLLDAVTGLSGSGPAYVMQVIEALSDGGVRMGLPRAVATRLAAQTVAGSAEMVLQTGQHPAVLRDAVTSPGGTTIAGLQALEEHAVRGAFISAVQAATERSIELGQTA